MALEAETKIVQSKNARTQYFVIPVDIIVDSRYPFKANECIRITIDPIIEISPKGIKGKKIEVVEE